jgi:regulatory protein
LSDAPLRATLPAMPRAPRKPRATPPPTEALLREAALAYLARYAATERGLLRVLTRRIDAWARSAADPANEGADAAAETARRARAEAAALVRRLAASGAVDDAAFAAARAARLGRAGRSRRAIGAHLAARGVDAETARATLPDDPEAELDAALAYARRRRIGPFRAVGAHAPAAAPADPRTRMREAAALARAGFPAAVARRALGMAAAEAAARIAARRMGTIADSTTADG